MCIKKTEKVVQYIFGTLRDKATITICILQKLGKCKIYDQYQSQAIDHPMTRAVFAYR